MSLAAYFHYAGAPESMVTWAHRCYAPEAWATCPHPAWRLWWLLRAHPERLHPVMNLLAEIVYKAMQNSVHALCSEAMNHLSAWLSDEQAEDARCAAFQLGADLPEIARVRSYAR